MFTVVALGIFKIRVFQGVSRGLYFLLLAFSFSYFYCLSHIPRFMKIKSQSRFIEYRFRYHLFISITYYITYHNIIIFSTFHKHIHIQICNIVHNAHFRNTIVLHAKTIVPLSRSEVADNSIRPLHSQADQEVPYEF